MIINAFRLEDPDNPTEIPSMNGFSAQEVIDIHLDTMTGPIPDGRENDDDVINAAYEDPTPPITLSPQGERVRNHMLHARTLLNSLDLMWAEESDIINFAQLLDEIGEAGIREVAAIFGELGMGPMSGFYAIAQRFNSNTNYAY